MSVFRYKVSKASWGVAIELHARFEQATGKDLEKTPGLQVVFDYKNLDDEEKALVKKGVNHCAKISPDTKGKIIIENVKYSLCDYQMEGLYCAILGWFSNEFKVSIRQVPVSFNKTTNKYDFELPA